MPHALYFLSRTLYSLLSKIFFLVATVPIPIFGSPLLNCLKSHEPWKDLVSDPIFFFKFNFFLVFVFRNYFWLYKCLTNIISTLQDPSPKNSSTYHCLIRLNHYELERVFQLGKNCHVPCVSSPARAKLAPTWSRRLPWKRGKFATASKTHTGSDKFCAEKSFMDPPFVYAGPA